MAIQNDCAEICRNMKKASYIFFRSYYELFSLIRGFTDILRIKSSSSLHSALLSKIHLLFILAVILLFRNSFSFISVAIQASIIYLCRKSGEELSHNYSKISGKYNTLIVQPFFTSLLLFTVPKLKFKNFLDLALWVFISLHHDFSFNYVNSITRRTLSRILKPTSDSQRLNIIINKSSLNIVLLAIFNIIHTGIIAWLFYFKCRYGSDILFAICFKGFFLFVSQIESMSCIYDSFDQTFNNFFEDENKYVKFALKKWIFASMHCLGVLLYSQYIAASLRDFLCFSLFISLFLAYLNSKFLQRLVRITITFWRTKSLIHKVSKK